MILSRKYRIEDIGISSSKYLANKIQEYLNSNNYHVKYKDEFIRFRRKPQGMGERGGFMQGVIHVYINGDYLILDFHVTNMFVILGTAFLICSVILQGLKLLQLIYFHEGFIIAGFMLAISIGLNGIYHFVDAKKKLKGIDGFVWSLK